MHHEMERVGLCSYCGNVCRWCNQCKCELKRSKACPGFDVKKDRKRFFRWLAWRAHFKEQERLWYCWERYKTISPVEIESLYERVDENGLAYYDS